MIVFIPTWKDIASKGLETDDLVGQIKAAIDADSEYKVLIREYIPNLRYFLHRYDLLESNYESLFDQLQEFHEVEQRVLTFDDLKFPEDFSLFYSPYKIFVYKNEEKIATIGLGEGGQIYEVNYFSSSILTTKEIYDDRGMLSSRYVYKLLPEENYIEYLDIKQDWIFKEFQISGKCVVNGKNNKGLFKTEYESIEEIMFELLKRHETQKESHSKFIVTVTDKNFKSILDNGGLEKTTLSFFKERYTFLTDNSLELKQLLAQSHSIIADSQSNLGKLKQLTTKKINKLSPFDTRFTLSISQELREEVIYFETRGMGEEDFIGNFNLLLNYLYDAPEIDNSSRLFKTLFRVEATREKYMKKIISDILFQKFPEELEEIKVRDQLYDSENTIDTSDLNELSKGAQRLHNIMEGFKPLVVNYEEEIFKIINEVRLVIDLSEEPDLFTQIAGISAGIPQINKTVTEYIINEKNGLIISEKRSLPEAISFYLENLTNWQEARTNTIQQIRKYSGGNLFRKLNNILGE